jgi:endonuclease/exonuclease/phosphatase family metal-dependent hydrolase
VALLYQAKSFTPIETQFLNVTFKHAPLKTTRDILYAKGLLHKTDTLHVFVNHWPSRWGGQMESEESRFSAATVLRTTVDSIYAVNSNANIIIMGDFNDEPTNKSVQEILDAKLDTLEKSNLYNLGVVAGVKKDEGTYKYQGVWGMLDQFIISETLLKESNSIYTTTNTFTIYNADFLLEKDENYLGTKPNRAFIGFRHNGGFSDHLPVFFDLYKKEN